MTFFLTGVNHEMYVEKTHHTRARMCPPKKKKKKRRKHFLQNTNRAFVFRFLDLRLQSEL